MLAILFIAFAIHLPHLQLALAIDLITGRMTPDTFLSVSLDARFGFLITQTELAYIHLGQAGSIIRIG